jgi:hypothetical protein
VTGGDVAAVGGQHLGTPGRQPVHGSAGRIANALLCARPLRPGIGEKLRPFRSSHVFLNIAVHEARSRGSVAVICYPYISGFVYG